jgi:hypothetical protein
MAGTYAVPSVTRSGTKRKRDGEKGAGRAHLEERRRRDQVQGGGSPAAGRWGKREASGERFARGREKNASLWEREDEQGATCLRLTGGPHRGGRRRLGNCPARAQAVGAGEPLGLLGCAPAERPKARQGKFLRAARGGGGGKKSGWAAGWGEKRWLGRRPGWAAGRGIGPREVGGFSIYFSYSSHNSSLKCMIHKPSQSNSKNCKVRHDATTK